MSHATSAAVAADCKPKIGIVGTFAVVIALVGGAVLVGREPVRGAEPVTDRIGLAIPVDVVNEEDAPVPGTVDVGNLPAVQSVEVTGAPTVHVASMPPVVVASSELPFQWAGAVSVGPGDFGSDCIELMPSDLPDGTALAVEQVAALTRINDPAADALYIVTIPTPTPEQPDAETDFSRRLVDLPGETLILRDKVLLGGAGGAISFRACVVGPSVSMAFRLFGHLVPVSPPAS